MLFRSGTVLFVSHDRYFIKQISDKLLVFEPDRKTDFYEYGYEEYLERKGREIDGVAKKSITGTPIPVISETTQNSGKKGDNPGKERAKLERKVKKAEENVALCEEEIDALKVELMAPHNASNYSKLGEIQEGIDEKEETLFLLMEEWETCQHILEIYNKENL